jgi:hypothetical protein
MRKEILSKSGRDAVELIKSTALTLPVFLTLLDGLAADMGVAISQWLASDDKSGCPYIVGTGGDFHEFATPIIRHFKRDAGYDVGCLWPYRSNTLSPDDEPLIYFNREYMEKSDRVSNRLFIVQSIATEPHPIEAVIERAREIRPGIETFVVLGAARKETLNALRKTFLDSVSFITGATLDNSWPFSDSINYWSVSDALDRRELKIVPKMPIRLLERLDATDQERLEDDWGGEPTIRFDI